MLGGTLKLTGLGSGVFDPTRGYNLLTAGNFTGSFSRYIIDPRLGIDASAFSFNGGVFGIHPQPVPEPALSSADESAPDPRNRKMLPPTEGRRRRGDASADITANLLRISEGRSDNRA